MEEKLINFLKENNVYTEFVNNVFNEALEEILVRAEIAKEKGFSINIIGCAFRWAETPEEENYWKYISDKWDKENFLQG